MQNIENIITLKMLLAICLAVFLPISLSFWILSLLSAPSHSEVTQLPSPLRWLVSTSVPLVLVYWAKKRNSLNLSGAIVGWIIGFIVTVSNYCFTASLLVFFLTSSKATKFRSDLKRKFEFDHKEGGQRNWVQVICNGGIGAQLSLFYLMEIGCSEAPINFTNDYNVSWFAISVMCSMSCANADTWASEFGSVLAKDNPFLITTLKRVPRGTNGGVSMIGLIMSALGGFVVGLGFYATMYMCVNRELLHSSPAQWPILIVAAIAGIFGSVIDSLIGATLQYSGLDKRTGKVVEWPGDYVQHISGVRILDNHSVNLLSTLITAIVSPHIAIFLWNYV